MSNKVAVVTGSNKGIGLAIVKGLCKSFDGKVYLTARNEKLGKEAVESLKKEGLNANFHQLEIDDDKSVETFAKYIKNTYGGLDILVNNAAIAIMESSVLVAKDAEDTMKINYFGTIKVSSALFPLLRSNARVVNVASSLGKLGQLTSENLKNKYENPNATIDDINNLVNQYIQSRKDGNWTELGYPAKNEGSPSPSYNVSKIALIAATKVQQRDIDKDGTRSGIAINAMCPGYCKTDMTRGGGFLSPEQGAETAIYLALLPSNSPKGEFWSQKQISDWNSTWSAS